MPRRALDLHLAAHLFDAFADIPDALPLARELSQIKPRAVVVDLKQGACVAAPEAYPAGGCLGVSPDIGQGFPGQLDDVRGAGRELGRHIMSDFDHRRHLGLLLELPDQPAKGFL